ncbi:MAG: carboxyltransferase domain-containing protein [Pseudomonadota bacterium]
MPEFPIIRSLGVTAMVVTFADRLEDRANRAALAFRAATDAAAWPGVRETSMSLASVYVEFDPLEVCHAAMEDRLRTLLAERDWYAAPQPPGRTYWQIPTVFGGALAPQFDEAAEAAGLTSGEALRDLTETRVRVMTLGFAPGQPYLGELPEAWNIPRQQQLTPSVPQGALIVAIRQLVLFTTPISTGWRHIGQTAFETFRQSSPDPFALSPGDEISFAPVTEAELARIRETDTSGRGGAETEVLA